MIDLGIAAIFALLYVALELFQRWTKRKQARNIRERAEEQQRLQDARVKETWRSGSREDRKNLEVQELERMMVVSMKKRRSR